METQTTQLVRRHWSFVLAYYALTSLAIGLVLPAFLFFCSLYVEGTGLFESGHGIIFQVLLLTMGLGLVAAFITQVLTDPIVFTRDVVCQTCHRRQRLDHNPLSGGRYYSLPKCECGGDLETAFFWKLEP